MCKKYKDGKRRHRNKFESANALPDYGVEEWRDGAQGKYYIPSKTDKGLNYSNHRE